MNNLKKCSRCGELLTLDNFRKDKYKKSGVISACKYCLSKNNRKKPRHVDPGFKYCFACKNILDVKEFYSNSTSKDGLMGRCKTCKKSFIKDKHLIQPAKLICAGCKEEKDAIYFSKNSYSNTGFNRKCRQRLSIDSKKQIIYKEIDNIKCTKCGIVKSKSEFDKNKTNRYGYDCRCKMCNNEYTRKRYHAKSIEERRPKKKIARHRLWSSNTIYHHSTRNIKSNFTIDELEVLAKTKTHCDFCNHLLKWNKDDYERAASPNSPTMDNLYLKDTLNISDIAIVCYKCNRTKTNMPLTQYIEWIHKITTNINKLRIVGVDEHTNEEFIKKQSQWAKSTIRSHKKYQNVVFNFTSLDLINLAKYTFNCEYCNQELYWGFGKLRQSTACLENRDLKLELDLNDVSITCMKCNICKSNRTTQEFKEYLELILPNLKNIESTRQEVL